MPGKYTVKEVEERTGVPASSLRQWERRYGFPQPQRSESGYRYYSEADVAAIGRLHGDPAAAVDRDRINEDVFNGTVEPLCTIWEPAAQPLRVRPHAGEDLGQRRPENHLGVEVAPARAERARSVRAAGVRCR